MRRRYWENELRKVEAAHGFERGYKLLYCPWRTIHSHKLVFLSLNPGGRTPHGTNPSERCISDERGNSYEVDQRRTRSPISAQFLSLCEFVEVAPTDVLAGVVAPFRSDSWGDLTVPQREAALDFGRRFWGRVLREQALGKPIVVCSKEAADLVVSVLGARFDDEFDAGWGRVRIRRYRTKCKRIIVHLPHLSRFRLFGRVESEPYLRAAFEDGLCGNGQVGRRDA